MYEFLDFTFELAKSFGVLPFEIFRQDKDEVIMLINYFVEKNDTEEVQKNNVHENKKDALIRVDDNTASGGWF